MAKYPNQIIGSFILRNEGDGCLTSKYHHEGSTGCPYTEACKRVGPSGPTDVFVGTFRTVWLEDNDAHVAATLEIQRHPQNVNLFQLRWLDNSNRIIFEGSGMVFEGVITGCYWN